MPLNDVAQKLMNDNRSYLIEGVNPFDLLPHLHKPFTPDDIQRVTNKTQTLGAQNGMVELLQIYEIKAPNLECLSNALRLGKYYSLAALFDSSATPSTQPAATPSTSFRKVYRKLTESYKRMFSRVKPVPTIDEVKFDMDDIFVSLQMESLSSTDITAMNYDSCLVEMFHKGSIVVCKGEPGAGKTTMVNKLCYDWAKGRWTMFDLVLCCKLREAPKSDTILDMVLQWMEKLKFLGEEDVSGIKSLDSKVTPSPLSLTQRLKRYTPFFSTRVHTLLILDGYDEVSDDLCTELTNIMKSKGFTPDLPFSLLLTSRPNAITGSRVKCSPEFVHLLGFDNSKKMEYIKNHFKRSPDSRKKILFVKDQLSNHAYLQALTENPLSLCLICLVHKDLSKTTTLSELYDAVIAYLIARGDSKGIPIKDNFGADWKKSPRIKELSRLAYEGLLNEQYSFTLEELNEYGVKPICTQLALLIQDEERDTLSLSVNDTFYFVHKSMQEFYAAFHLFCVLREIALSVCSNDQLNAYKTFYSHPETTRIKQLHDSRNIDLDNTLQFLVDRIKADAKRTEAQQLWCRLLMWLNLKNIMNLWSFQAIDVESFSPDISLEENLKENGLSALKEFFSLNDESKHVPLVKLENTALLWVPLEQSPEFKVFFIVCDVVRYSAIVPELDIFHAPLCKIIIASSFINKVKGVLLPELSSYDRVYFVIDEAVDENNLKQCQLGNGKLKIRTIHFIIGGRKSAHLGNIHLAPLMNWFYDCTESVHIAVHAWNCNICDFDKVISQPVPSISLHDDVSICDFVDIVISQAVPSISISLHNDVSWSALCGSEKNVGFKIAEKPRQVEESSIVELGRMLRNSGTKSVEMENSNYSTSQLSTLIDASNGSSIEHLTIKGSDGEVINYPILIIGSRYMEKYGPDNSKANRLLDWQLESSPHSVAALIDGKVYVVGGDEDKRSTEVFDPVAEQWLMPGPEMTEARNGFAGVAMDDQLMVFGGDGLRSCESLNTVTQMWSPLPAMEWTRWGHNAIVLDGKIYLIGGGFSDSVSIFDPVRLSWHSGSSSWAIERHFAAAVELNSTIIVTGGYGDIEKVLKSCIMLDPRQKELMVIESMLEARSFHALVNYKGRLLAMGGINYKDSPLWNHLATVEQYEARVNKWEFVESLKESRGSVVAVPIPIFL